MPTRACRCCQDPFQVLKSLSQSSPCIAFHRDGILQAKRYSSRSVSGMNFGFTFHVLVYRSLLFPRIGVAPMADLTVQRSPAVLKAARSAFVSRGSASVRATRDTETVSSMTSADNNPIFWNSFRKNVTAGRNIGVESKYTCVRSISYSLIGGATWRNRNLVEVGRKTSLCG